MNIVKVGVAAATTASLIFLMHFLIARDLQEPKETDEFKVVDITMPEREIKTQYETPEAVKPDDPTPPPEMPEMDFDTPDLNPNAINMGAPKVAANLKVGGIGGFSSDGEYLPIVKVQPVYPRRALARGIEGYVIVEFVVTKNGSVRDPVVVEAEPEGIFNSAAMKAALKFKYKPRVVDGEPIEVPGVRNKITFAIAK
ncbi:energy transducer TonB [Simiduia agarivorans]|uniref:Protein TonB n=1 Tax=Simiduia agarivorans (strain DSM 21679 / JCM 13881 / BCRC 17597 / SA1) TaxID=1117647 RepID=K4KLG0_SIMAS|nr:energy transducer TonB [Simiduia agarivorans]AFU99856.2 periplasmic protein TonB [Simiduia agarivorans SA1 = DSM 21679]